MGERSLRGLLDLWTLGDPAQLLPLQELLAGMGRRIPPIVVL